ncbi:MULTISPECIES: DUF29 domain-containing protein [unclassified Aureimonas]|uniref:DUF29 domain-containing protein n=1 Tax=unclassified Aureimonas TaxID=2615206 RepID=UPI0006FA2E9D|nr:MULTISPECIES: DUF29 domain-containing protein [unclassified Aureimonas]KQT69761.1 hypothetical protein ASG62_01190 [Aureimonas sp. Leaf427]KQT76087.1 hypothetical protein ASG54_15030 [Aureimonas sp. Leaf460]
MSLAKDRPYYPQPADYEDDTYSWAMEQAQLLRLGRFSELDLPNLIEEIEGIGLETKRQLSFHYRDLVAALLEWQALPADRRPALGREILEARIGILDEERESRWLRDNAGRMIQEAYPPAVRLAMAGTGLPRERFPYECPYSLAFLRDLDAMPMGSFSSTISKDDAA